MRTLRSNVSLVTADDRRQPGVFVDCVRMRGVLSAEYKLGEGGARPTMTVVIVMPHLAHGKPRVRRKCGTRPHIPSG